MKAKKVYEFKRTRKQGLSDQTRIGPTVPLENKIKSWFNEFFPNITYELQIIKNEVFVILEGEDIYDFSNNDIDWFPDNIICYGNFTMNDVYDLPKLGNKLEVHGKLDLAGSKIEELPDDLYIDGEIDLSYTAISKLPDSLFDKRDGKNIFEFSINLDNSYIEELPENLVIENGILDISDCANLKKIPDNLTIKFENYSGGNLIFTGNPDYIEIGNNIYVENNVTIYDNKFPENIIKSKIKAKHYYFY